MTKLRFHPSPRWRESEVFVRDRGMRSLIVALEPSALLLRQKGRRGVLRMPFTSAYDFAAALEARRIREEKKSKKNGERKEPRHVR